MSSFYDRHRITRQRTSCPPFPALIHDGQIGHLCPGDIRPGAHIRIQHTRILKTHKRSRCYLNQMRILSCSYTAHFVIQVIKYVPSYLIYKIDDLPYVIGRAASLSAVTQESRFRGRRSSFGRWTSGYRKELDQQRWGTQSQDL